MIKMNLQHFAKGDPQGLGDLTPEVVFDKALEVYEQQNLVTPILTQGNKWNIVNNGGIWTVRSAFPMPWSAIKTDHTIPKSDLKIQEKNLVANLNIGIYTEIAYDLVNKVPKLGAEDAAYSQAVTGYAMNREIIAMNELLTGTPQTTTTGTKISDRMSAAIAQYMNIWGTFVPNELVFVVGDAGMAEIFADPFFNGRDANLATNLNEINNGTIFSIRGVKIAFSSAFKTKEYALVSLKNGLVESPLLSGFMLKKLSFEETADFNGGALKGSSAGLLKLCTKFAVILGKAVAGETALTVEAWANAMVTAFDGDLGGTTTHSAPAPDTDVASAISQMSAKEQKALYETLGVKKV